MPHKFNAARRHKFDKVQYRVINWAEYNESLRQRGDLTIWVSEEAQSVWSAPRRTSRGGQRRYSDLAIETCLMLRTAYHLGLRQTQGLMGSIGTLMGLDIRVPDYSTLSRRANGVSIAQVMRQAGSVPIHLVVDSTGLKIFGEGEWLAQKHNTKGIRRRWRKLHLGLDLASGAIVCAALTHDNVGDSTALPSLLDQLDAPVTGFLADGAADVEAHRLLEQCRPFKVLVEPESLVNLEHRMVMVHLILVRAPILWTTTRRASSSPSIRTMRFGLLATWSVADRVNTGVVRSKADTERPLKT